MVITGYTVDKTTQQITSLEVNGETVETGTSAKLFDLEAEWDYQEDGDRIFIPNSDIKEEGYDGISRVDITITNVPIPTPPYPESTMYAMDCTADSETTPSARFLCDTNDFTTATVFYFCNTSSHVIPGTPAVQSMIKINPTVISATSLTYNGHTYNVYVY